MGAVSAHVEARARKNESVVLRALAEKGQVSVAAALGVHESTVSRMKDKEVAQIASFLSACGLKVVDERAETFDAGYMESLRRLLSVELSRAVPTSGFGALDEA